MHGMTVRIELHDLHVHAFERVMFGRSSLHHAFGPEVRRQALQRTGQLFAMKQTETVHVIDQQRCKDVPEEQGDMGDQLTTLVLV